MFAWITGSSLRLRRLIAPMAIGLIALGVWQAGLIDRDVLPEFSPTRVEVQTEALGLSAEEVEQLVTSPLEQDLLNGVAFLEHIESASLPGLSSVVLTFEEGTDVLDARQVVNERLTQAVGAAGLPQVASLPQMLQPLSSTSRVAIVAMSSQTVSQIEMSVLARWVVAPRLLGAEGVANVSIWGFRDRQLQVLVDPVRLADQNVTLSQVIRTTGNSLEVSPLSFLEASTPGTGGFIDTANQRLHIFHQQAISTPEELGQVPLEGPNGEALTADGQPVTLGQVAEIVEDHQPLIGDAHCAEGPCLLLVIEKFPEENAPEVVAAIDTALAELAPGLDGITLDSALYQPADFLDAGINNLGWALAVGAVVLLLLLTFFLGWRVVTVAAVTAATAGAISILAVQLMDLTLNLMIIAGLVLALVAVVDDAITGAVSVANQYLRETGERDRFAVWRAAMSAALETRRVAWYGTLIAVAALLPIFFLRGEAGAFLPPVAWGYALGIAAGMAAALVVAPGMSMILIDRDVAGETESATGARARTRARVTNGYRFIVSRAVGRFRPAVAAIGVVTVAAVIAVFFVDVSMRPNLQERAVVVNLQAPAGTALPSMSQTARQVMDEIAAVPGVDDVKAHVGRAVTGDQIVNVNSAEVWAKMSPDAPHEETLAALEAIADRSGVESSVVTYSDERVSELLGRDVDGLVVRVYGDEIAGLQDAAETIAGSLERVPGVEAASVTAPVSEEMLEVEVDIERAQALGLKPGDVRRTAAILMSGITVGNLFEEQKVFDVVVWGTPEIRSTMDDLQNLSITTPSGDQVPLSEVAEVRLASNPAVIRHESVSPYLDVAVTAAEDYEQAQVAQAVESALGSAQFTLGFHASLLGEFSEETAAQTTVLGLAGVALVTMYLLFQAALNSWRIATLGLIGVAFAVAIGLLIATVFGVGLSVGSVMGLLAGVGLVARGVILLIRRYHFLAGHGSPSGSGLIEQVAVEGMPSTVFTHIAVIFLFLPVAVRLGAPGMEVAGPMALSVIGSALGAGVFTLVLLPALESWWGVSAPELDGPDDLFASFDASQAHRVQG